MDDEGGRRKKKRRWMGRRRRLSQWKIKGYMYSKVSVGREGGLERYSMCMGGRGIKVEVL